MKNKLLKKIVSMIEEKPHEEAPQPEGEAPAPPEAPLSPGRKQALVTYLALLLALAFLVVAISLFIQQRSSEGTIDTLNQNANQALARAELLQEENESLRSSNKSLQAELDALNEQLEELEDSLEDRDATIESMQQSLDDAAKELENAKTEAETQLSNQRTAYTALIQALQAQENNDHTAFEEAMIVLSMHNQYLDQAGLELYQTLLGETEE